MPEPRQPQHADERSTHAMDTQTGQPALMPIPEAARLLGLSRASAYRYAEAGQLPVKKFGRRVYVVRAQLATFLASDAMTLNESEAA